MTQLRQTQTPGVLTLEVPHDGDHIREAVEAQAGRVVVILPESASTGYLWTLDRERSTQGVRISEDRTDRPRPKLGETILIGGTHPRLLGFEAPAAGEKMNLIFVLARPWLEDAPARSVRISITGV